MGDNGVDAVSYLPASLVRAAGDHPVRGLPWCDEVDGTMVMADLSGFTNLSERLASLGDEGAERLTGIINSFFARMLETASRYGGDTLTFGGDAILLLFDGPEHAGRAVAASLAMLRQVERAAAVDSGDGKVKIGMSVGAHSARFSLAAAGLTDERALSFVLGRDAELTALAEAQAERGQLAISASTLRLLSGDPGVTQTGDYWRVDQCVGEAAPQAATEPFALTDRQLQRLAPFLPPYARTAGRNDGERVQLTPEHRRTVIAFVNILGLDEVIESAGVGAALGQLQSYSAMLTRLAATHHGFVVSSDIATKGSKLVITFGSPVAHEYAPANAARFALDLTAGLRASGLDLQHKIGVNGGHVFAGEVGPPFRRQYTVMGDDVNLAARLMAAADPGSALISRKLLDYAGPTLCARELEPIKVKGKEQAVAVCVLEEERGGGAQIRGGASSGREEGRLFGRRAELLVLRQAWEQARGGDAQTVLIEGDAGVGKTRLIDEALKGLARPGRATRAACFEHLRAAPFTPWVDVLYSILGLSRGASTGERTEAVRSHLEARLPDDLEMGSLLNPLLTLSLPQSDVVGSLDSGARRERLFGLVSHILADAAAARGHIVVIEDIHWIDESSLDLVRHLGGLGAGAGVLLLLTTRPTELPLDLESTGAKQITLAELTEAESLEMVREALDLEDLPGEVGEAIYAKTKGNPLFLEEVVRSLQAPGVLERILGASSVARAAELAALEIPDRVQGLLMSRIDRLPADTREVLKAGSVVGRSFDATLLEGIEDDYLRPVSFERAFAELVDAALVVPGEADDGAAVSFRHALVQDVAYESLPFSRRRELHGRVASYLESTQPQLDHGLLVHHYRHAGDVDKTQLHAVRASESSAAAYASPEAIDYLAVALDVTRGRTSRDACLRSRFEELMGDSQVALARHDDAIACFASARRRWASSPVRAVAEEALRDLAPVASAEDRDALLCWKIAVAFERGRSAYRRSLTWLDRAAAALPQDRKGTEARILTTRGVVLSRLGRYQEADEAGQRGVELAREGGDVALLAFALNMHGSLLGTLGLLDRAIACSSEAIPLYEREGDLYGQAVSHANVGADYTVAGDFRPALEHLETSLALHSRIGNVNGIAFQHLNLGGLLSQMGELDDAIGHLEEAIRLSSHQGVSLLGTGFAFLMLARARLWSGSLEQAQRALDEAFRILESIDAQSILLDAGIIASELCLAEGDLDRAETVCRKVVSESRAMNAEYSEGEALTMLGRVLIARDSHDEAIPDLEASIVLAGRAGSDYERAKALAVLAEAQSACTLGGEECAATLDEAIRLFEKMGAGYDLEKALEVRDRLFAPAPAGSPGMGDAT